MNNKYDIAVVGQGIAGTLLTYFLRQKGKRVFVIDNGNPITSSKVAAGIVNPVTGKNFIKSWRVDEFLPFAKATYDAIASDLGVPVYKSLNLLRCLHNVEDENNWLARTADDTVKNYMLAKYDNGAFKGKVRSPLNYGELQGTFFVDFKEILSGYKKRWLEEGNYLETSFEYDALSHSVAGFTYQDICFDHIVFCEGYRCLMNPYFNNIDLKPTKGEVLMVHIPEAKFDKIYKDQIFIVPQGSDIYWIGSNYTRHPKDEMPTQEGIASLKKLLSSMLTIPYEVVDFKAAIRPTMQTRRPILKTHQSICGMHLFNGLGTKGASIGPFMASRMSDFIITGESKYLDINS